MLAVCAIKYRYDLKAGLRERTSNSLSLELVSAIRQGLADNANPEKAAGMRAYMKSAMPYRGVQTPMRRKIVRAALRAHPLASRNAWLGAVLELWRNAAYREERYAAPPLLKRLVTMGRYGRKSGAGFYEWTPEGPVALRV